MNPTPNATALLAQLRDVHDPGWPGLWPPAPGWWAVALIALLGAGYSARWGYRRLRLRRYRRALQALFDGLRVGDVANDPSRFAAEVSALLRRVALARFPRHQVAALQGDQWLQFLDRTGGDGRFSDGPGQVLADGPYRPEIELEPKPLLLLAKHWVTRNT